MEVMMKIVRTSGENPDFIQLCRLLDANLEELVAGAFNRDKYSQFNQLDDIRNAVVLYVDEEAAAGGAFKQYDNTTAELKRVFVRKEYRGRGLSKALLSEIEIMAMEDGYKRLILETGELLKASMALYSGFGFEIIESYGQYKGMPESICMGKMLQQPKFKAFYTATKP